MSCPCVAWYRDDSDNRLHEPHHTDPPRFLTAKDVYEKTGVKRMKVEHCDDPEVQQRLREEGGYNHFDWLEITRDMPDFDIHKKRFYTEHLHIDQEVRLITEGSGYFEVRDVDDRWIRLYMVKGDMIDLPPGIYHRLTLDDKNCIKMLRFFLETPKWSAIDRPEGDSHPVRVQYLESLQPGTSI